MATTRAAETLVVNERERDALRPSNSRPRQLQVVSNGIDLSDFTPTGRAR